MRFRTAETARTEAPSAEGLARGGLRVGSTPVAGRSRSLGRGRGCGRAGPGRGFQEARGPSQAGPPGLGALRGRAGGGAAEAVSEAGGRGGGARDWGGGRAAAAFVTTAGSAATLGDRGAGLPVAASPRGLLSRQRRQEWARSAAGPAPCAAHRPQQSEAGQPASFPGPSQAAPTPIPAREDEGDGLGAQQPEQHQQQRSGEGVPPFPLSRQDKMAAAAERG